MENLPVILKFSREPPVFSFVAVLFRDHKPLVRHISGFCMALLARQVTFVFSFGTGDKTHALLTTGHFAVKSKTLGADGFTYSFSWMKF